MLAFKYEQLTRSFVEINIFYAKHLLSKYREFIFMTHYLYDSHSETSLSCNVNMTVNCDFNFFYIYIPA